MTLCRQNFNKPIRPAIDVLLHPEGPIIVAYISEAETFVDAGAEFIVSPIVNAELSKIASEITISP